MPRRKSTIKREFDLKYSLDLATKEILDELTHDAKNRDTDPKKVEALTKLYDRSRGLTPGRLPQQTDTTTPISVTEDESDLDIPNLNAR